MLVHGKAIRFFDMARHILSPCAFAVVLTGLIATAMILIGISGCATKPGSVSDETTSKQGAKKDTPSVSRKRIKSHREKATRRDPWVNKYEAFCATWQDTGRVDVDLLVEIFLYSQVKSYNRGDVGDRHIPGVIDELKGLSRGLILNDPEPGIIKEAKRAFFNQRGVITYNRENDSIFDYFLHKKIQCSSGSKLVMLIAMMAQWDRFNDHPDFMDILKDNLFVYTEGHVRPGWIRRHLTIEDVIVVDATEKGRSELNLGTFDEMKVNGLPIKVCRADLVFMADIADAFGDRLRSRIWRKQAVLFEQNIVYSNDKSSVGSDTFGFGNVNVAHGDQPILSVDKIQAQVPYRTDTRVATIRSCEPIVKLKKGKRERIKKEDFERNILQLPLSNQEKRKCLEHLSAYLKYVNKNRIQHLGFINKEIMARMGDLGFDFGYVLENDDRIEYVSGMFTILSQIAAEKEMKNTGRSKIEWERSYEILETEIDDYLKRL